MTSLIEDLVHAATGFEENLEIAIDDVSHIGESEDWITMDEEKVRHVWCPANSEAEITVPPSFYSENGTPVDPITGDDMEYIRTEILP